MINRRQEIPMKTKADEADRRAHTIAEVESREDSYRAAFEHSMIGLYRTSPDGRILLANQALLEILGFSSFAEIAKRNLHQDGYEPDLPRSLFLERIEREGAIVGLDSAWLRKDGSILHVRESARVVRDENGDTIYYEGTVVDITEQVHATEQLQAAHEQLNATLNALPDLLFEVDRHGTILDFRAPNPNILYTEPREFLGKRVTDCIPAPASATIMKSIKKATKTGQHSGASYSLDVRGKTRWFELSVAAKGDASTGNIRFIALVRDITDRREAEDELRRTTLELAQEQKELTEKNITLKQILDHLAREKKDFRRQLSRELDQTLKPYLKKLMSKDTVSQRDLETLGEMINAVLSRESDDFEARYADLTPREKEICDLISDGLSSKQISDCLVLSPATIHKHREQIRKKLKITNKSVNLSSYLRSNRIDPSTQ